MDNLKDKLSQTHINIMEELVYDEIERQLKHCSYSLAQYLNRVEVATYALNRLPPLYASCEKGKHQQKLLGQRQYREQIKIAVRQGLAAVQRDPLRSSTPLISETEADYRAAKAALVDLQNFLEERNLTDYEKLSWANLVSAIRRALQRVLRAERRSSEISIVSEEQIREKHGFEGSYFPSKGRSGQRYQTKS